MLNMLSFYIYINIIFFLSTSTHIHIVYCIMYIPLQTYILDFYKSQIMFSEFLSLNFVNGYKG